MSYILPDVESLEVIHEIVLEMSGGKNGVLNQGVLEGAIARPQTYANHVDEYDLDTVCAVLIDSVARNHGFQDGNKRTALMTAIYTYKLNNVHFEASMVMNMKFDELIMWVVTQKPTIDAITARLKELRKRFEGSEESFGKHIRMMSLFRVIRDAVNPKPND